MNRLKTMKQLQLSRYGSPDAFQLIETDIPKPKAGGLVIKEEGVGINYSNKRGTRNGYGFIVQGQLKIETTTSFALKHAVEAYRQVEARRTTEKIVLTPNK